jgi:hypothetical protein
VNAREWGRLSLSIWLALVGCGDDGGDPTTPGQDMSLAGPDMTGADALCTDTCAFANDGECDDGGPGALYAECALGTDCGDCGPREASCTPDCAGRACGDDGCGGTCGSCGGGACDPDGQCREAGCGGGMVQCSDLTGSRRDQCTSTSGCTPVEVCYGATRECDRLDSRSDCEAWSECVWSEERCERALDCEAATTESECRMMDLRPTRPVYCQWGAADCVGSATLTCESFDDEATCLGHGCTWS